MIIHKMNFNISKHIDKILKEEDFSFQPRNIGKRNEEIRDSMLKKLIPNEIHEGHLNLTNNEHLTSLGKLKEVKGNLYLSGCKNLEDLGNLEKVYGGLYMNGCSKILSLDKLRCVDGPLMLFLMPKLKDLGNLKEVRGRVYISKTTIKKIKVLPEDLILHDGIATSFVTPKKPGENFWKTVKDLNDFFNNIDGRKDIRKVLTASLLNSLKKEKFNKDGS